MSEQSYRSAGTLLAQLASGETTSVALVNHYFSRMAQFNKPLNAVVQQHYALALEAAARADRERLEGRARGVLHGLPCTVKESFDVQGWLTTSGAHYLKDNRATQDAPSIARLRAAGAILMGKTNVPMMTADWQTYNDLYGTTHNLWDRQRSPGGSSGGAAVAVAAVPLSTTHTILCGWCRWSRAWESEVMADGDNGRYFKCHHPARASWCGSPFYLLPGALDRSRGTGGAVQKARP